MEALKRRRAELFGANLDVPVQYTEVLGTILHHATPLPIRLFAAGDSQAAQSGFEPLALEDVARLFLTGAQFPWVGEEDGPDSVVRSRVQPHPL